MWKATWHSHGFSELKGNENCGQWPIYYPLEGHLCSSAFTMGQGKPGRVVECGPGQVLIQEGMGFGL